LYFDGLYFEVGSFGAKDDSSCGYLVHRDREIKSGI
jgi:hypothetical protein